MKREAEYKTRQKALILNKIKEIGSDHITVEELTSALEKDNSPVGKSTVYRFLEKLAEDDIVKKHTVTGERSVCYQYVGENSECKNHYHLVCEKCGKLIHMKCNTFDKIGEHILEEHNFVLNGAKSTLYGVCSDCVGEKE